MWQIKLLFKKLLKFLFNEAIYYKVDYLYRVLTKKHHPKKIINLGLPDPDLKRERAAIVYLTTPFEENWKFPRPNETNIKTIVGLFIQNGYTVDLYDYNYRQDSFEVEKSHYKVIFGFGKLFDLLCKLNPDAKKIMYATEAPPSAMAKSEQHVLTLLLNSGIKLNSNHLRAYKFQTDANFITPDTIIALGSTHNEKLIRETFNGELHMIDCAVRTDLLKAYPNIIKEKYTFAWVGSSGAAMKGVHHVLKFFAQNLDLNLHIFGMSGDDLVIFEHYKSPNMYNHGFVNMSSDFFQQTIMKCSAVISTSYCEGQQTSIATSLILGTKALVTNECGYSSGSLGITIIDRGNLEISIREHIKNNELTMTKDEILNLRQSYSTRTFLQNIEKLIQ